MPPLDSVPPIFFSPDFDLSNPRIFASVSEQTDGADYDADPSSLSYSLPLLERLSHYADTVEQHLVREISIRSSSFFAALTNLNELQTESSQCLERVRSLRGMLKEVDEKGAKKGLQVVHMEKKLQNLGEVQEAVKTIQGVGEMIGVARNLANGGEFGAALGVVEQIQHLWDPSLSRSQQISHPIKPSSKSSRRRSTLDVVPESPREEQHPSLSFPLSSLNAFTSLPEHLRELTVNITTSLTAETVSVLKLDLITFMESDPSTDPASVNIELRDRLQPLLECLQRTKGLRNVIQSWREVILVEIRSNVRSVRDFLKQLLVPSPDQACRVCPIPKN